MITLLVLGVIYVITFKDDFDEETLNKANTVICVLSILIILFTILKAR
ncbi:MAG: hypothetical protein QXD03_02550 [Candidatus Anstonellales archaeon]